MNLLGEHGLKTLADISANPRHLWVPFVVWLVVSLILMASFETQLRGLDQDHISYTSAVNIAGRQRMNSQRVALIATRFHPTEGERDIAHHFARGILTEIENASASLLAGNEELGTHPAPEEVRAYLESEVFVATLIRFRAIVEAAETNESLDYTVTELAQEVLSHFEHVTGLYQAAAFEKAGQEEKLVHTAVLVALLMLGLLALLFAVPSQWVINNAIGIRERNLKRVERHRAELEKNKGELHREVAAKADSQARLERVLGRTRNFNLALEKIFTSYVKEDRSSNRLIAEVTQHLCEALQVERASIWLFTADHKAIICEDLFELGKGNHSSQQRMDEKDFPAYFEALNSSRIIDASSAFTDPRTAEFGESYLAPLGICSMLDAPILAADQIRGVICCESIGTHRDWSVDEIGLITSAAQFVGMSLSADNLELLAKDLETALRRAEIANQTKSEFLASMSHEIRTPMNGVLGMAELMLVSDIPDNVRENVEIIQESGEALLAILNDILDLSKIEAGKVEFENIEVDLKGLIGSVLTLVEEQVNSKGLTLKEATVGELISPVILADPTRIRQVLTNLLSNAAKFTHEGGVSVTLGQQLWNDGRVATRFEVTDTGIGLKTSEIGRIFDTFHQADQSTTRQYGGTGLGLSICKKLVEQMGGEIGVTSTQGKGSSFWFTIVGEVVSQKLVAAPQPPAEMPRGQVVSTEVAPRLLVAEDNVINQKIISKYLEALGYEYELVENGQEALNAVLSKTYELILMDVNMPVLDGIGATRSIRELPGDQGLIPIIALTANAMKGDKERYIELGMDDYISKPINPTVLADVIARNCQSQQAKRA